MDYLVDRRGAMKLAQAIKKMRFEKCMEQDAFAKYMQISKSSLCNYETGRTIPRMKTLRKFMDEAKKHNLKIKVDDFLNDDKK